MCAVRHSTTKVFSRHIFCLVFSNPMKCISHLSWFIIGGIITIYSRGISVSVFLKHFPLCTDIISHLSSSASILRKSRVFMYCSCFEMMDIVVYEYLLTPLIISSKLKQYL
jgi:hypothetical protein